jgi:hypothetical protein
LVSATVAWFILAGALGGVLVTSIVGLSTAMLNHRWQGQQAQVSRRWQLQDADRQLQQDRAGRHLRQKAHFADFALCAARTTPPQAEIRQRFAELVSDELIPSIRRMSELPRHGFADEAQDTVTARNAVWRALVDLGATRLMLPRRLGGEEAGRRDRRRRGGPACRPAECK